MKIIADPNIPFVGEAFSALGDIELVAGRQISASTVRDADVLLVRSVTPVNAALLDHSKVKFVATATIGTDHVDEHYLRQRGIGFASAQGSNANSVAEYVVAAMLEIAHRDGFRLRDKTIGVIGVGNIGSRVVRYAEALGMRVLQNDPPRERMERNVAASPSPSPIEAGEGVRGTSEWMRSLQFVSLDRVCAEADIITLHVPLTKVGQASRLSGFRDEDATYHLFDAARLAALEQRSMLINTSRGAVVDNSDLVQAFHHRHWKVSDAVLDVWESEPDISTELLTLVDIGTPHIAGYSFDGKVNGTRMIYRAVCEFLRIAPTWSPSLPPPPVSRIELNLRDDVEDDEAWLHHVVKRIYNISDDDAALRRDPDAFDRLRAEYPVRREFFNTELVLRGASDALRQKFAALRFKVVD